jgi:hypothetical protein
MPTCTLPVSGLAIEMRAPTGDDDALLAESPAGDLPLAAALAARLARRADGADGDWGDLPVTDLEVLLLMVRSLVFGGHIRARVRCPGTGCGADVEARFAIADYLDHHRPRKPRGVAADERAGWFRLSGNGVSVRLPTVADLLVAAADPDPGGVLAQRCISPAGLDGRERRRAERAMAALSPSLHDELHAECPSCRVVQIVVFDPIAYVLQELRDQARWVFDDVHVLASAYHWPERDILALPRRRRHEYIERVGQERTGA